MSKPQEDDERTISQLALLAGLVGAGVVVAGAILTGHAIRGLWVGPLTGIAIWLVFRFGPRFFSGS